MRLFLASYRFGSHQRRLLELVGDGRRVAVIANACDAWGYPARNSALTSDLVPLRKLGFDTREVDLRDFVGAPDALREVLAETGFVWVRGGNTFVLRAQLARCGGDHVLTQLLSDNAIVYAGYSAGACVLTPSLVGLESADDPAEVEPACGIAPIWTGLNLVPKVIVPHYDSDPTAKALAARYRREGIAHWPLTDEQVVLVDGAEPELL